MQQRTDLPDISTPEARAHFRYVNRQGAPAFDYDAAILGEVWRGSKDAGTALVLHAEVYVCEYRHGTTRSVPEHMTAEEWYAFRIQSQRSENERRDRANEDVCSIVLMAYIEGRDSYARTLGKAIASHQAAYFLAAESVPSYTELRNFLMGELDARPVVAMAAAFRQVTFHNKLRKRDREAFYGHPAPDTGWL